MSPRRLIVVFGLALGLSLAGLRTGVAGEDHAADAAVTLHMQLERGLLEWRIKDRTLLVYAFASNQFKPYVREFYTLAGDNLVRDAPADHLHHHGLMYAIRVNGINFWEENNQPGRQRHVQLLAQATGRSDSGLPQASFTQLIHWVASSDNSRTETAPFLIERRTLTLTVDEANDEAALAWHAEFEVGGRTNHVTLHGADYNGLGLRLPAAWDRVAAHQNSEGAAYVTRGKRDVFPARWGAVSCTLDGRAGQVVICGRPRGQAGTNMFFSMTEPFTYLSATQGLDLSPLEYRAGDRFSLDYLVLAYSAARTSAQIEVRYQAWVRALKSSAPTASKVSSER